MCMSGDFFVVVVFLRNVFIPGYFGGKTMFRVLPPHIMSEPNLIFFPWEKIYISGRF